MRVKLVGFLAVLTVMILSSTALAVEVAPASFTLSARGMVNQGVTVKPVMKKQRAIGLVVLRQRKHTMVGTVPLGTFSGRPSIHWNLKVHGKLLGSGSYLIYLKVFAHGKPTNIPAPPPRKLTITGQHVRVT